eukprot:g15603.t1
MYVVQEMEEPASKRQRTDDAASSSSSSLSEPSSSRLPHVPTTVPFPELPVASAASAAQYAVAAPHLFAALPEASPALAEAEKAVGALLQKHLTRCLAASASDSAHIPSPAESSSTTHEDLSDGKEGKLEVEARLGLLVDSQGNGLGDFGSEATGTEVGGLEAVGTHRGGANFDTGVPEPCFERLLEVLKERARVAGGLGWTSQTTLDARVVRNQKDYRITLTEGKEDQALAKVGKENLSFVARDQAFDVRVSFALEVQLPLTPETAIDHKLEKTEVRKKERTSFQVLQWPWVLDLTKVSTFLNVTVDEVLEGNKDPASLCFEVEAELQIDRYLALEPPPSAALLARQVLHMMCSLSHLANAVSRALGRNKTNEVVRELEKLMQDSHSMAFNMGNGRFKLPGAKPYALRRRHLSHLRGKGWRNECTACRPGAPHPPLVPQFLVGEKTHGERVLLLLRPGLAQKSLQKGGRPAMMYLIDNHGHVRRLLGRQKLERENLCLLLDGELLEGDAQGGPAFVAFDGLYVTPHKSQKNEQPLADVCFTRRYGFIANKWIKDMALYAAANSQNACSALATPGCTEIEFRVKRFVPLQQIEHVFARIAEAPGPEGRPHYYYANELGNEPLSEPCPRPQSANELSALFPNGFHPNDGLIFPNPRSNFWDLYKTYKWKWPTELSVDFLVLPARCSKQGDLYHCPLLVTPAEMGPGAEGKKRPKEVEFSQLLLPEDDYQRLVAGRKHGRVLELGFDRSLCSWFYKNPRDDKRVGNNVLVAFDTLLAIVENITVDE